jgi:hypothetical protein
MRYSSIHIWLILLCKCLVYEFLLIELAGLPMKERDFSGDNYSLSPQVVNFLLDLGPNTGALDLLVDEMRVVRCNVQVEIRNQSLAESVLLAFVQR